MNPTNLAFLCTFVTACLIPLFQFPEVFLGNQIFGHPDFYGFSIPIKKFFFDGLMAGDVKYFYPFNLLGSSLFSGPHYQIFYIPNLFWIFFPSLTAFKLQYFFNYPLFACGLFLFLKELNFSNKAIATTTVLTTSCGIIWSMHVHPNELDATAWLPISLFFFAKAFSSKQCLSSIRIIHLFLSALTLTQSYLAGDPWSLAFGFFFMITLWIIFFHIHSKKFQPIFLLSTFLGFLFLFCYPFYYLHSMGSLLTERHTGFSTYETFMYSSHWLRLTEFFVPWLIPGFDSPTYPWKESLSKVYPGPWYYEIGYGIIYGIAFAIGLLQIFKKNTKYFLLNLFLIFNLIFIFFLATGINSEINLWLWEKIPTLSSLRFPERLLKYSLIPTSIIACSGFNLMLLALYKIKINNKKTISNYLVVGMLTLALMEVNSSFIVPNTISSSVNSYPSDLKPLEMHSRLLTCDQGFPEFPVIHPIAINLHPIAWGLSTVYEAEAMVQVMNKTIDCKLALQKNLREWIGFTHVMSPYYDEETSSKIESTFRIKRIQSNQEANFNLYEVNPLASQEALVTGKFNPNSVLFDSKNLTKLNPFQEIVMSRFNQLTHENLMFFDPHIYLNYNGLLDFNDSVRISKEDLDVQPYQNPACILKNTFEKIPINISANFQKIQISYEASCEDLLLVVPYAFTLGWIAYINEKPTKIYRINDWVMGILIEKGFNQIEFRHALPKF